MNEKYESCNLIQHGLCFFEQQVVSCCYSPVDQINGQHPPVLYADYKGELLKKEDLFSKISKYTNIFKKGGTPHQCVGCCKLEKRNWEEDDDQYINSITITHYSICNADCIYCSNNLTPEERTNEVYEILPVLQNLKEQNIIRKGVELHIGGGEFSIYKEHDSILKEFALTNFARVFIPTNAIKYSHSIFEALNNRNTFIIVSIDSGCRSTFKKIKRIDAFEKVVNNLKKYASTEISRQQITLKYIVLPTINDNLKEFKKFVNLAKKLKIKYISIDIDSRYSRSENHHIDYYYYELINEMKTFAEKTKAFDSVVLYSFIEQDNKFIKEQSNNIIKRISNAIKVKLNKKNYKKLYSSHKY